RESFLRRVVHKRRTWLRRIINTRESALCTRDPKPSQVVQVKAADHSRGHTVCLAERLEVAIAITRHAAPVKTDPKIAAAIFLKRRGCTIVAHRNLLRIRVDLAGRSLPTIEVRVRRSADDADPDIAARVFVQTKRLVTT